MNVVVTGATGFIGQRLVDVLAGQGHAIKVLSHLSNRKFPIGTEVVKGDLTSSDCELVRFLEGCEVVFHCAGEIHDVAVMRLLHIDGTQRLLQGTLEEAARRQQTIHWVQLSSVGAYGPPDGSANMERIVTEDTLTRPQGEYEITKTQSDDLVIQASESGLMTHSIIRPSNVFGQNMPNQSLQQLGKMVRKGLFFYIGQSGAVATYVHVDDVVAVLLRCGFDPRAKGQVFNVSNDCLLEEMIAGIASAAGVSAPRMRLPEPFVRKITNLASKIAQIPLTQERIDALVARTRYPYCKLEQQLGVTPQISVRSEIGEVVLS